MREIYIDTIDDLLNFFCEQGNSIAYRGHLSSDWKIESTLYRTIFSKDIDTFIETENFALREFRSKFSIYKGLNDEPKSLLSWLSLMQHYGAPTRLIDFTTSPFIALVFILENYNSESYNKKTPFCLYSLNYSELNKIFIEDLRHTEKYKDLNLEVLNLNSEKIFEDFFTGKDKINPIFMMNEPINSNIRIDRQQGTFLISTYCEDIENELSLEKYSSIALTKTIINNNLYIELYKLLRKANISTKVIYGDLEGLGKSLKSDILYQSLNRKKANDTLQNS